MIKTAAAVFALLFAAPAAAQEVEIYSGPPPHDPYEIWQAAPAPEGAVSWQTLMATGEVEEERELGLYIVPDYTPEVLALDGETIQVNGYMMPLEAAERHDYFLLMAYPPDCPFCLTAGPPSLIEVYAAEEVDFTYDAMLLEGQFELLYEDETGLFYRLNEARLAEG